MTQREAGSSAAPHRVWMIISTFYPVIGGAQRQVEQLVKALQRRGWETSVLTRRHSFNTPLGVPAHEVLEGIPVTRAYSRGRKIGSLLFLLNGFWHLLRHGRGGIYHAHDIGASAWLAVLARYLLGGRCLVKLRTGRNAYQQRFASRGARWRFVRLLRLADRVVVVNSEVEQLAQRLGIPASALVRIPNAVDLGVYTPVPPVGRDAARRRLGFLLDHAMVLYVGRLEQVKGVDVLLRGWAALPEPARARARLIVVGDGGQRVALEAMADTLGVSGSITWAGEQPIVHDYYRAADLFVLPSRSEGLANALVEAMACGLPVVASKTGGALDLVDAGKNGALFEAENAHALARELDALLRRPDRWESMGREARRTVLCHAELSRAVEQFIALYRDL